jgi:membrane peptidoglycan carboxypeptidase
VLERDSHPGQQVRGSGEPDSTTSTPGATDTSSPAPAGRSGILRSLSNSLVASLSGPLAGSQAARSAQAGPSFPGGARPVGTRTALRRRRRHFTRYLRRSSRARIAARSLAVAQMVSLVLAVVGALLAAVFSATVSAAGSYYESRSADIAGLGHTVAAKDSLRIFDANGTLLFESADQGVQESIPLAKVPVTVINATVAIEDRTFWDNSGVDFTSILRAAYANLIQHQIAQGGSTITQQLIKYNLLNSNETFDRKLKEAVLAYGMTTQGVYTKRQILEMYLNTIPYGREAYGINAAARSYFGYSDDPTTGLSAAQRLDLAQASMLAGIPQNPNLNNPLLHPQHARDRQAQVLKAMVDAGYITQAQADAATAEAGQPNFFHPRPAPQNLAPHFAEFVRSQLEQMVVSGQLPPLSRSGLNVYTTLDLDLQNHVQDAMKQHLYGDDRDDYVGHHFIHDDHVTNTAAILVDHHNGAIKVMLGSVDFNNDNIDGQVNVVTDGYRGPGSTFKPIVYATAFEKGWFPAITVSDTPTIFWDAGQHKPYKPLNFNINQFNGQVTLRKALQYSLNIPAVKVMNYAGVDDVQANAQRWGIRRWEGQWGLSSVLGSLDVTLYDMTQVYTVFANYGQYIPMHAIDRITDGTGASLFQYQAPQPVQVMSPQVAYLITSILSDNPSRAGDFGACSPLYLDADKADCQAYNGDSPHTWPAAAKTGTGQDFRDDYTIGYTMDYTMGVWAGNTDHTPMIRIDGITGAAPTWYRGMLYAERNLAKRPFPVPPGVHRDTYTSDGVTSTDWFVDGPTPPGMGSGGPPYIPCVTYNNDPANPWDYCKPGDPNATPSVTASPSPLPG